MKWSQFQGLEVLGEPYTTPAINTAELVQALKAPRHGKRWWAEIMGLLCMTTREPVVN